MVPKIFEPLKFDCISIVFSDMYTFDTSVETAKDTYNLVCDTYCRIFERLGLKYVKG